MATKITLVDDLDGTDAAETVVFAINGESYTIDLSEANVAKFRKALAPFTKAAKREGDSMEELEAAAQLRKDIRAWASKKGMPISARGKIPQEVIDAYNDSH